MKVYRPSKNKLNGGYSRTHKGYDFDDVPNNKVFASFDGVVTIVVDKYTTSWIINKPSDPWYNKNKKRKRRTADYGNFVKLKGKSLSQISAHFKKGAVVKVGQKVKEGDLIGYAGNNRTDTGNSSGGHSHTEFRNSKNINQPVTWLEEEPMSSDDEICIKKKTFEMLVTKASERDKWHEYGYTNPEEIERIINDLKEDLKHERETNGQLAKEYKGLYQDFLRELAGILSPVAQKEVEIYAAVRKLIDIEDLYTKLKPQSEKDRKECVEQQMKLEGEIARLKAMLDYEDVLKNSKLEELIKAIIRRFTNIVRRES